MRIKRVGYYNCCTYVFIFFLFGLEGIFMFSGTSHLDYEFLNYDLYGLHEFAHLVNRFGLQTVEFGGQFHYFEA